MSVQKTPYGQRRFRLGIVEVGIICAALSLCVWLMAQKYNAITNSQDALTKQVSELTTQIAVLTDQVQNTNAMISSVTSNTRAIVTLQAVQQEHERRLQVLESYHGARVKGWTH